MQSRRRATLQTSQVIARLEDSDAEDDFDIPHDSDDSGSSSEEEDLTLNPEDFEDDKNCFTSIVYGREDLRLRDDPPFLGQ